MDEAIELDSYLPFSFRSATFFCAQKPWSGSGDSHAATCSDS